MPVASLHSKSIAWLVRVSFLVLASGMFFSCGASRALQEQDSSGTAMRSGKTSTDPSPSDSPPPAPAIPPAAASAKPFSNAEDLESIVSFLASDDLKGRDTGSEGLEMAAAYLEGRLEAFGIRPYFSTYRDTLSNTKETAFNIVGYVPGSDPELSEELVLIGAHYDHIGIVPLKNGDGIANGANDNASGTATILELARYFSEALPPRRSLVFAFFSAEERGLLGSKHLSEKLEDHGASLYTVLNFEMTGVPMKAKDYMVYLTGYQRSNMAEVANRYGQKGLVGYLPRAGEYNLFQRSDNYPFFQVFKVPAHTFSTFDFTNYPYYHQPGDEAAEMDFAFMAMLVNRMIPVVSGIADAPTAELKLH